MIYRGQVRVVRVFSVCMERMDLRCWAVMVPSPIILTLGTCILTWSTSINLWVLFIVFILFIMLLINFIVFDSKISIFLRSFSYFLFTWSILNWTWCYLLSGIFSEFSRLFRWKFSGRNWLLVHKRHEGFPHHNRSSCESNFHDFSRIFPGNFDEFSTKNHVLMTSSGWRHVRRSAGIFR